MLIPYLAQAQFTIFIANIDDLVLDTYLIIFAIESMSPAHIWEYQKTPTIP